jgi:hypothetical protein
MQGIEQKMATVGGRALAVGVVATVAAVVGAMSQPQAFFQAYLMGYLFWLSIALGSLVTLMIHHLTGGAWLFVIRRPMEAAARTIPLLAVLFIPLVIGMQHLYPWSVPEIVAADKYIQFKTPYLNETFFIVRAILYFAIWGGLAFLLTSKSYQQDEDRDALLNWPMRKISGIGIVLYAIASTFASFDWIMSLDPNWFSSIYGPMFMTGHGLTALSFLLVVLVGFAKYTPYAELVSQDRYHDLGKWLFALVVLWAYMMLSQFIIIWSGNLPEHIVWYLRRLDTPWKVVAVLLTLLHFAVPFAVLLSRLTKQKSAVLVKVAIGLLLLRFLDLFWMIAPEVHQGVFVVSWLDFVTPAAIGGIWLYFFFVILRAHPQRVAHDPRFEGVFNPTEESHG